MFRLKDDGNMIGLKDSSNDRDCTRLLATRLRAQTDFSYLRGNELLMLEAASRGAHGAVASLANLVPRLLANAFERATAGDAPDAAQQEIDALMGAFGLFEERPQDSTTLRLMALKSVLNALGIMDTHMAQLAPSELPEEWTARARAFAEQRGLVPQPLPLH